MSHRLFVQVDVREEEEDFQGLITACLSTLILAVQTRLDGPLQQMCRMPWAAMDVVGHAFFRTLPAFDTRLSLAVLTPQTEDQLLITYAHAFPSAHFVLPGGSVAVRVYMQSELALHAGLLVWPWKHKAGISRQLIKYLPGLWNTPGLQKPEWSAAGSCETVQDACRWATRVSL